MLLVDEDSDNNSFMSNSFLIIFYEVNNAIIFSKEQSRFHLFQVVVSCSYFQSANSTKKILLL